jgi:hypothetical protein
MSTPSTRPRSPKQQEVCIDLPGESVQCWRSADNLKVVLRKHRDIIFDLKLGKGKSYTVQSTHSDFYNARDKKLVYAKRNDVVTFNDGERMHLWVTRNFKGALLLKCDNKLMMKIEPNEIDHHQYSDDPKTKPSPIIIAFGPTPRPPEPIAPKRVAEQFGPPTLPPVAAAAVDQDCSIVCVIEGNPKDMPERLLRHFKKGGGKSGLADVDPNDVITRNWIWGQIAGSAAYVHDNWDWLRASIDGKTHEGFKLVRAKVHFVRGQVRFYFSGYSKFNAVFGPGGFAPGHERIINIFAGAGKTSSAFAAVAKGVLGSVKGNALVSFIFSSATSVAEWKDDISKDGYDLAASLIMGLLKTLVAAAITVAAVALFVSAALVLASSALSVLVIGAVTLGAGIIINYSIEVADKSLGRAITGGKSTDGVSDVLSPFLRTAGSEIQESWKYLTRKFPLDYEEILF